MKKQSIIILSLAVGSLSFTACNDFLDREPLSSVTSEHYLNTEAELASFGAAQYDALPAHKPGEYSIGVFKTDNNSDNQCAAKEDDNFVPGERRVPTSGEWDFKKIRDCNYFLETVLPKYEEGKISGLDANIRHYIGEMYFFRAFQYFTFMKKYGDFPIVDKILSDDYVELAEANQRRPQNEVARFILDDLYRWRALDRMKDYQVEGFNLWDENYKLYDDLKVEGETDEPNVSSRYNKYLRPYQIQRNNKAYLGYTFMKAHYLAPIAYDVIRLSTPQKGGDISTAYIYQNPGWDVQPGTSAKK